MTLSVLADFAPGISGPLSAAIAVTAVTYYGIPILDNWLTGAQNPVGFPGEQSKPKATTQKRNG
jgi:hypothetical protein